MKWTLSQPVVFLIALAAAMGVTQQTGWCQTLPAPRPLNEGQATLDAFTLTDLLQLGLDQNPDLRQAALDIDAAQGRAVQAGLYPNPTVSLTGDELGDVQGPAGINTLPLVTQEIVTAGKLRLSRAVASREVDQATLALVRQRFVLFTIVRQGYFEVLAAQRRVAIWTQLVNLGTQSLDTSEQLFKAKQVARLDVLPFRVESNRFRAELAAARREEAAAWRRLAANMGVPSLPPHPLAGTLDAAMPPIDYDRALRVMLEVYPDIRAAQIGVERAQLALTRAKVEPIPNVAIGAGYVRQNQNRSDDWTIGVSVPVPVFNRNQGNIHAAQADLGRAIQEVRRVENDLVNRLATAFGEYAAALERITRYRDSILPDANETYRLAQEAFKGGQFEYLRVLQAQRAMAEADLAYVVALADGWRAASAIAGLLLLEEYWPGPPPEGCVAVGENRE